MGMAMGSPLEKVVQAGGRVLMLGAPLDTVALLHYAEHVAKIPDKRVRRYRRLMPGPVWVDFEEFDTGDPVHDAPSELLRTDSHGLPGKWSGRARQGC